jgi:hypothetical protein
VRIVVKNGDTVVATIDGQQLEVADICSLEGAIVHQLATHGVPLPREEGREWPLWRVQPEDPDFAEALAAYLAQHGLAVETSA